MAKYQMWGQSTDMWQLIIIIAFIKFKYMALFINFYILERKLMAHLWLIFLWCGHIGWFMIGNSHQYQPQRNQHR